MSTSEPAHIPRDQIRVYDDTEDGGLRVGVALDAVRRGSALGFGVKWIKPGTERVSWEAGAATHEAYYVHSGELRVGWVDRASGEAREAIVRGGECFYLAPGHTYSIENAGPDDIFGVWACTPPPEPVT
jgi:mannose-6-phosphate isomerase-like protein (cupin superfamily)